AAVAAHAAAMRVNLLQGSMPPWHADAPHGTFANDTSLTPQETARLAAWADAGAPRGDGPDPLALNPPPPVVDWPLGPPDVIVSIPTQQIPSFNQASTIRYRYITNSSPFATNVWLRAVVVRPENRRVVHHALVFAGNQGDLSASGGGLGGFFAGYVPGVEQTFFPDGLGKQLKAGSLIVFQMHYTPTSTPQTDRTELGLYLSPTPPARELKTGAAYNLSFVIPPQSKSVPTSADKVFAKATTIYEMSPHMHFRGASMRFDAILPDHTVQTLLNVPNYDFAWQTMYRLAQPVTVPAGTTLRVSGTFDNSVWNPFNPDPARLVFFGEQTSDEMFIGYVNYAEN
ncbi:MAG: alkyl hydroperoxide reductase, partial [Verrucomicrobia bacterium]